MSDSEGHVDAFELPDAVSYRVPKGSGIGNVAGIMLAIFGFGGASLLIWTTLAIIRLPNREHVPTLFAMVPMFFTAVSLVIFMGGLWLVMGTEEIELTASAFRRIRRLGPLTWTTERSRSDVVELSVIRWPTVNGRNLAMLRLDGPSLKPMVLARAKPLGWVRALAARLSDDARRLRTQLADGATSSLRVAEYVGDERHLLHGGSLAIGMKGCGVLFFGIFFIAGLLAMTGIVMTLLGGDPNDKMAGVWPWKALWILFPVPHLAIGLGGLYFTLFRQRNQNTGLTRVVPGSMPTTASRASNRATKETRPRPATKPPMVETWPTIPSVSTRPGTILPVALERHQSGCGMAGYIMILLFEIVFAALFLGIMGGDRVRLENAFVLLPIGVFLVTLFFAIRHFMLSRLPVPELELDVHPFRAGTTCDLFLSQSGPLRLNALRMAVLCEEQATYRQGTNTVTKTEKVFEAELLHLDNLNISAEEPCEGKVTLELPRGVMHSFAAEHNKITWKLVVYGDVPNWPNVTHEFPFIVLPQ